MANKTIITPEFTGQFPHVFEPEKNKMGGEDKYVITMVFSLEDVAELKALAQEVAIEKWGKTMPSGLRSPFRNSDTPTKTGQIPAEDWGFGKGMIFVKASSKFQPGVVKKDEDGSVVEVISPREIYGGCKFQAEVSAYAYDTAGNVGVSFYLQNLMKTADGTGEYSRKSAVSVFGGEEAVASSEAPNANNNTSEADPFAV